MSGDTLPARNEEVHAEAVPSPDPLEDRLRELAWATEARFESWVGGVEEDVFGPLRQAVEEVGRAHESLASTLEAAAGRDADGGGPDGHARGRAVAVYRTEARQVVLPPLAAALRRVDPLTDLAERWTGLAGDAAGLAGTMPERVTRSWPAGVYRVADGDGPWRVLRKLLARGGRRMAGGLPTQSVPLRALARFHMARRVAPLLEHAHDAARGELTRALADLEHAAASWTDGMAGHDADLTGTPWPAPLVELMAHTPTEGDGEGPGVPEGDEASTPEPTDTAGDAEDPATAAVRMARDLQAHLSAAAFRLPDGLAEQSRAALDASWEELETDADHVGTFMLEEGDRVLPGDGSQPPEPAEAGRWTRWQREVASRMSMAAATLALRDELTGTCERAWTQVAESLAAPLLDALNDGCALSDRLRASVDTAVGQVDDDGGAALADALTRLRDEARDDIERSLRARVATVSPRDEAARAADDLVAGIQRVIDRLPTSFEVHTPTPAGVAPSITEAERHEVELRAVVHQAFDTLRMEGLRTSVEPVLEWATQAVARATEVNDMLLFNLDAVVREANSTVEASASGAEGVPAEDSASGAELQQVLYDGLASARSSLEGAATPLAAAIESMVGRSRTHLSEGWRQVTRHTSTGPRIAQQLRGAGMRLGGWFRGGRARLGRALAQGLHRLRVLARLWRWRLRRLVRMGTSAVGVRSIERSEGEATLIALVGVDRVVGELPRVYQRLFSFDPLEDPSMLKGRDRELTVISRKHDRWSSGMTAPVLVTCASGGGATSFLRAIPPHLDLSPVSTLSLDERIMDEAAFVETVGEVLDAEPGAQTLAALAEWVLRRPGDGDPPTVIVERLEHLMLRAPGGTELVERALSFMAMTDARVFWIASMAEAAWNLIRQTQPHTATLPFVLHLGPLDRKALEVIILERHRRSGLGLEFRGAEPPRATSWRMMGVGSTRDDLEEQNRRQYFDALHRASAGSVTLALYYWLRSVRFDHDARSVSVEMPPVLNFEYLRTLHLEQAFTLKAFLEHTTLTLAEHGRVFGSSPEESFQLFESLVDRLLIVPFMPDDGRPPPAGTVQEGVRYRVRPMLSWPISEELRRVHMLY